MSNLLRKWLEEYKATLKCYDCGEDDPICLSFHHLDPDKKTAAIYQLMHDKECTLEQLEAEIAKCIVLCFNCHLKYHRDKRLLEKCNDIGELSSQLGEEGTYSLWSQDDAGSKGLYD